MFFSNFVPKAHHFRDIRHTHSLQETVLPPNQWYRWKAETPKVCLLLGRRVCVQEAIGRYRPMKDAEKWSRDITKIENLHIGTCKKIHWFQKCILFDLRRKITKLPRKNRFRQWRYQAHADAWPSWIDARRQYILLVIPKIDLVPARCSEKIF